MDQQDLAESEADTVEQALAGGSSQRVGRFSFCFDDERWQWSPVVQAMHGYEPGTVEPTTELVLSHKHPEDYSEVVATLEEIRRTREPFSTRHRIIDPTEKFITSWWSATGWWTTPE
jgi:hypothetical protein